MMKTQNGTIELGYHGTARTDVSGAVVVEIPAANGKPVAVVGFKVEGEKIIIVSYQPKLLATVVTKPATQSRAGRAMKIRKPKKPMPPPHPIIGEAQKWTVELASGKTITEADCYFNEISEPIKSLTVAGGKFKGADAYYFVRDCIAAAGCQSSVIAIEAGGRYGDQLRGLRWNYDGSIEEKEYLLDEYPFNRDDLRIGHKEY